MLPPVTTTYAYDSLSRLVSASNPAIQAGPLAQQGFTANGQRASLTDANSNTTSYTYDGFDRLTTTSWPDTSTETLDYDAGSNIVARGTRAGQAIAYAYDGLNRLVTKTPPAPWPVVSYAYDLAGRVTGVSDTSAAIASIATPGSTTAYTATTAYDALNRPTGVTWDPAPTATAPAAGPVVTFGHGYNAANQRTAETASDTAWLAYPAATPATTSYTANALNQYTAVGAVTPTWSGNGNLTFDGTMTLGHDPENRLVSASGAGNTAAYAFDPRGRRKVRTVNGTTTITITGADNRELLDYDGSNGAILRWYAYGPGPNAVLSQMNVAASTRDTLLPNLLGSIVASVDSGTGNISPFGYQPYGTTSAVPAQFGYTGQRVDQETGLYYYRARHYSPQWGRFTQADPIGYQGGINLYGYVGNDPLNAVDPLGLDTQLTIGLGGTAALQPFGLGGSYSAGINVPDNPLNIRGYQLIVGQVQANAMVGVGGFVGFGLQLGVSRSTGALPVVSTSVNRYFEANAGFGPSVGIGVQTTQNPGGNDYFRGGVAGTSVGLPGARPGYGAGVFLGVGVSAQATVATPTFGQIYDYVSGAFSSLTSSSSSTWGMPAGAIQADTPLYNGSPYTNAFNPYPSYSK